MRRNFLTSSEHKIKSKLVGVLGGVGFWGFGLEFGCLGFAFLWRVGWWSWRDLEWGLGGRGVGVFDFICVEIFLYFLSARPPNLNPY